MKVRLRATSVGSSLLSKVPQINIFRPGQWACFSFIIFILVLKSSCIHRHGWSRPLLVANYGLAGPGLVKRVWRLRYASSRSKRRTRAWLLVFSSGTYNNMRRGRGEGEETRPDWPHPRDLAKDLRQPRSFLARLTPTHCANKQALYINFG